MAMSVWLHLPTVAAFSIAVTIKSPNLSTGLAKNRSFSTTNVQHAPDVRKQLHFRRSHFGESPTARTVYTVVSLACMFLIACMIGLRFRRVGWSHLKAANFTRLLVFFLYFISGCFVISAAVLESGLGLSSRAICHSAIIVCLVFYVGSKVTMYTFLVERAHAMRGPYMQRKDDWIWLGGMAMICAGFGGIALVGFISPVFEVSQYDGKCRIGLPAKVTIPLLSFDIAINVGLTSIFIYLIQPLVKFGGLANIDLFDQNPVARFVRWTMGRTERRSSTTPLPMNHRFLKSMESLLLRSLMGSILVIMPTLGNLVLLYRIKGRELGWLCLTICTFDVTWAVCIIHWLTNGPAEEDEKNLAMLVQPDSANSETTSAAPL